MSIVLQPQAEERLRSDKLVWLTTVRPNGRLSCAPVWFFWENATITIFSKPNTPKIHNLRQNRYVMLTFGEARQDQNAVILEGKAELLERGDGDEVVQAYGEKYSEGLQRIGVTAREFTMLYAQPIRITPILLFIRQ